MPGVRMPGGSICNTMCYMHQCTVVHSGTRHFKHFTAVQCQFQCSVDQCADASVQCAVCSVQCAAQCQQCSADATVQMLVCSV